MKNRYLNQERLSGVYAQGEWGFWKNEKKECEDMSEGINEKDDSLILGCLKRLAHHKYCDLILLCSVAAAFGMLLAVSTIG